MPKPSNIKTWDWMDNRQREQEVMRREANGLGDRRHGAVRVSREPDGHLVYAPDDVEARHWRSLGMPDPRLSLWPSALFSHPVFMPSGRRMWAIA